MTFRRAWPHNRFVNPGWLFGTIAWAFLAAISGSASAQPVSNFFRVATFNLENYLAGPVEGRPAKPATAKAAVREAIHRLNAQVLALEEMGDTNSLLELRSALKSEGLDYPYWAHLNAFDTNVHLALLSALPLVASRPQTNSAFLLNGRRFFVRRGFLEVEIRAGPHYTFTLLAAHLKSKRPVPQADQAELRMEEALQLRRRIDELLKLDGAMNLVVAGDLNDTHDSKSTRVIMGKGRNGLIDTRPVERVENAGPAETLAPRSGIAWTYYYAKEDSYSRIDYILVSRAMAREWDRSGTFILTDPNWGGASDHRPIVAQFWAEDR